MHQPPDTRTLSKAESSRINGAHSNGPSSTQGKLNSANARLKHGAYSKRILMDCESEEGYDFFKSTFVNLFLPADPFEAECVESMVTARWRIRRLEATEASNLNIALAANKEKVAETFEAIDIVHERAVAVQDQMAALDANTRVQERLHRIYDRNFKLLANYRKQSGRAVPVKAPAEPDPLPTTNLTDEPTAEPSTSPSHASTIAKVAMLFVIFALLCLTPLTSSSKTIQSVAPSSAFSTPAGFTSYERTPE
jgi:hypothetical protein